MYHHSLVMASRYHRNWQSSKKTVLERNAYMFQNKLMSDVSFTCGKSRRIFHAHKYVLAASSAVFYSMFYRDFAQKEATIHIMDAEEKSFKEFLWFLYTDDCKITAENAIGIMYLAKKYLISCLAEKCSKVLETGITSDNVFAVLEQAIQFDENDLQDRCWKIVSMNTLECINSKAFCYIGSYTLNTLLKRQTLAIAEVDLFKAVLKWTDNECARQGINIEVNKMARRDLLGDSLYEIRFLEMPKQDFATYASTSGMLTDAEIVTIFQKFNGLDVAVKWKDLRRRQLPQVVGFSRFDVANVVVRGHMMWCYHGNESDALTMTVNKAVNFHGVRLFGKANGSAYNVKFTIKGETVTGTYTSKQDEIGVWGYNVMLPTPILLRPRTEFTMIATIDGPRSQNGVDGKSSVKVDDIVVTFKNPPSSLQTNGTDKNMGQFYKVFLSSAL